MLPFCWPVVLCFQSFGSLERLRLELKDRFGRKRHLNGGIVGISKIDGKERELQQPNIKKEKIFAKKSFLLHHDALNISPLSLSHTLASQHYSSFPFVNPFPNGMHFQNQKINCPRPPNFVVCLLILALLFDLSSLIE